MIISPCISICKLIQAQDIVMAVEEIMKKKIWKLEDTTDEWKKRNIQVIKKRLTGWQLESFEES